MKIKKLKLDNFAKFTDFEIEFDGKITNLIGINGSGKTTIGITAIWACLKGIAEKGANGQLIGDRFRFIGKDKKVANIELTLFDEQKNAEIIIRNKISKDSNKITFHAPKNYKMDSDWLNNLFSVAFLSAKNFTQYSSKQQALLLGIDTGEFDRKIIKIKEDYTYINRQVRAIGEIQSVEKVDKVSISDLIKEKNKIDTFNAEQEKAQNDIDKATSQLTELEARKEEIDKRLNALSITINHFKKPEELIDISPIIEKINNAEEINQKALLYQTYLEKKSAHAVACKELEQNKVQQEYVMQERIHYIKAFNFGFKELSVGEDGGLLLNNRPIKDQYFSKGELELIVAKLHASKNPELKVRFIDDFELLDEKNQEIIIKDLLSNGFQIITAQVGDDVKSKENTILLRECKKV